MVGFWTCGDGFGIDFLYLALVLVVVFFSFSLFSWKHLVLGWDWMVLWTAWNGSAFGLDQAMGFLVVLVME